MRNILVLVTAVLAVGLLGGCAGMPTFGVASDRVEVVDYRKMQLIDDQAKRIGVTVIWKVRAVSLTPSLAVTRTSGYVPACNAAGRQRSVEVAASNVAPAGR